MKHQPEVIEIGGREVTVYSGQAARALLIQPVDSHDMEEMAAEIAHIEANSPVTFTLAAVRISRWNAELTPWPAPPVFGKTPFGDGAASTLAFILDELVPRLSAGKHYDVILLGGYSLAGLFALWAAYQTDKLMGVAAASPSVWYRGWLDYSRQGQCRAEKVYLSLGNRESHSKNALMATVADAITEQKRILDSQTVEARLEWNEGNHFTDNGVRTARGFEWLLGRD